jgi:biopolymer transport protein TolQ
MGAGIVVKFVMIMLFAASVWSWAIIVAKFLKLKSLHGDAERFEVQFWSGESLDDLFDRTEKNQLDPMSAVFCAAMLEWRRSFAKITSSNFKATLQQRIERVMSVTLDREVEHLQQHMGFLSSVASVAPFIGLFGTVWGIMTSFRDIAAQNSTSLAVVAPGMAEALLATAMGLAAAIPSLLAYNKISYEINRYANRLDAFTNEFGTIISRQLEDQQ